MESVPKIVVKRLQSAVAESHPDADLLAAFAERSLTAPERDHIVEHLARCGDCREVVSLALPPQVESQPLADNRVNWFQRTLLRGTPLRWAAVAAGVLLIASVATMQYRRQQGRELASNAIETKPAIATPAQSSQPAAPAALPETGARQNKLAAPRPQTDLTENKSARSDGTIVLPRAKSAVVSRGALGGPIVRSAPSQVLNLAPARNDSVLGGTPASPPAARQNPVPAPAPQTVAVGDPVQTVEAQSETVEVTAQSAPQIQIKDQRIQNETPEQSADRVGKAKPASAQASLAMAPPSLHSEPILMKGLAAPRWTITANGELQRSYDGGQTWQEVNVAANDSALDRRQKAQMMTVEGQADLTPEAQPEAQAEAKKQAKSREKQSAPVPTIFRALSVSSNAAEVWAGGSSGALYHTTDAGNSWARVLPSASGINLTGDIVSIQFSDLRNGTVTTSTAEVWTTPNAGQTWHKQP
jgi:Photosynthesis system II assembly factor YCF48